MMNTLKCRIMPVGRLNGQMKSVSAVHLDFKVRKESAENLLLLLSLIFPEPYFS